MFNLKEFVKENLVKSVVENQMAVSTANLTAVNYMTKGLLTEDDVAEVATKIKEIEDSRKVVEVVEEEVEEPVV